MGHQQLHCLFNGSNICSHERKHQNLASLVFVRGIRWWMAVPLTNAQLLWVFNTSTLWQNGCHFSDNIFRSIFDFSWKKSFVFWLKFHWHFFLRAVPKVPVYNDPALVEIMAWQQAIIWTNTDLIHWGIYVALQRDESINKTPSCAAYFSNTHSEYTLLWQWCNTLG